MTCIYYHIIGGLSRPFFKVLRFFTYAPQRTQFICKQISCIYRPFGQSAVKRYSGFGYYISVYFRRCLSQSNIYGLAARKILNLFKRCIGHRLKPQNSFISPVNRECAVRYQCKIRRCVFADIILNIRRPDEAPYQSRFSAGRSLCIPKPPHTPCRTAPLPPPPTEPMGFLPALSAYLSFHLCAPAHNYVFLLYISPFLYSPFYNIVLDTVFKPYKIIRKSCYSHA